MQAFWWNLYRTLSILFLPFLILGAGVHCLWRPSLLWVYRQRFSLLVPEARPKAHRRVWLHAVSVGEVVACAALICKLQHQGHTVYLSSSTSGGLTTARQKYHGVVLFFFPFDYTFMIRRVLRRIQPAVVLVCEVEIWPAFSKHLKNQSIPLYLISGRLGDLDFPSYRRLRFFFRHVLAQYKGLYMKSELDAERMRQLCDHPDVRVLGNLKFDIQAERISPSVAGLLPPGFLICAASTHRGDEALIIPAFKRLLESHPRLKLIIAPRHVERAAEVAALVEKHRLACTRRSSQRPCTTPVMILDSVGELLGVFSRCQLVIMGGSFSPAVNGHNIIEPALYRKCVLCGEHMRNFWDVYQEAQEAGAVVTTRPETLAADLGALIEDRRRAQGIGERAYDLVHKNRGTAERICAAVFQPTNRFFDPRM